MRLAPESPTELRPRGRCRSAGWTDPGKGSGSRAQPRPQAPAAVCPGLAVLGCPHLGSNTPSRSGQLVSEPAGGQAHSHPPPPIPGLTGRPFMQVTCSATGQAVRTDFPCCSSRRPPAGRGTWRDAETPKETRRGPRIKPMEARVSKNSVCQCWAGSGLVLAKGQGAMGQAPGRRGPCPAWESSQQLFIASPAAVRGSCVSFTEAALWLCFPGALTSRVPRWEVLRPSQATCAAGAPGPSLCSGPSQVGHALCPPPHSLEACRSPSPAAALARETWSLSALGPRGPGTAAPLDS